MITIAFTVSCRRPKYLARTVQSWARCRGEAQFVFSLEPPIREFRVGEFTQWVHATFPHAVVIVHPQRLGCNANTYQAMRAGFGLSGFTVVAEEDIEVSDDAIEYFTWASETYRSSPEVFAACAHVKDAGTGTAADVFRAPWFSPLVWGTWRDRWEDQLQPGWLAFQDSWDAHARFRLFDRGSVSIFPALSRSRHFGENSTMVPKTADGQPNFFHRSALTSCFFSAYGPQQYAEAAVEGATLY